MTTVRGVSPEVREENKRRYQQQQDYFEQRAQSVRQTLRDMGRQDLVDDLDNSARKYSKISGSLSGLILYMIILWLIFRLSS